MYQPLFSVVIPAYNNAEYLPDAINSVLGQSYPHLELLVVNDASPDNARAVIQSFKDPRVRYIEHAVNKGLSAARNTGILNATGNYVALLDGDDYFQLDKFKLHAEFLKNHPDVDVTYNARFELNHSSKTIREIWRPAVSVGLRELMFSYPFGPSDMVVKRERALEVNMFDEYYVYVGEDLDFNCRLALAGCKFHSVDRALNYRRYHSNRIIKDLKYFVDSTFRALKSAFVDSRCPQEIVALQDKIFASHLILWSAIAFTQSDTAIGQEYCRAAVRANPAFLTGQSNQLLSTLISYSIVDENQDNEQLLHNMMAQLPSELSWLANQTNWAIARGYLWRFVRAMMWNRPEDGKSHFEKAMVWKATVDQVFLEQLSAQINSYEIEFGAEAAYSILESLRPYLEKLGNRADVRWLKGHYSVNKAFRNYKAGEFTDARKAISQAIVNDPSYIFNRGVLKVLFNSLGHGAN